VHAGKSSEDMLNESDLVWRLAEGRSPLCAADLIEPCWNVNPRAQIGAHENDPSRRRGRQKPQPDHRSCQKAHAVDFDGPADGALRAKAVRSHDLVILDAGVPDSAFRFPAATNPQPGTGKEDV
jgi:hypothetical protein